jgi:hypothetical protein
MYSALFGQFSVVRPIYKSYVTDARTGKLYAQEM